MDEQLERRLAKLPRWAQDHICFLERRLIRTERAMADMAGEGSEGCISWEVFGSGAKGVLPDYARVTFRTKDGSRLAFSLRDGLEDRVNVMELSGQLLAVIPVGGNSVNLKSIGG